ncbi:helicase-exonuclease AddAB subunit AddA [Lacticigenium naphthae]|uniref:helicase-exonuclease AddAB subunit AddA n=1 Tax=Lacticigenium naphthae TaxID=515351 RepID=UPI00041C5126|nr:helicase-exonuclease AddAB subunit AddA [Lacticigenium naphthae]
MSHIPMKPANELFTDKQWEAIHRQGNNLLVSASAGSGKTTVLVRRVIEKIKAGTNIDELLVVTFTNDAAKEMKERVQQAVRETISSEPETEERKQLQQQLTLLNQADISTLHSFCLAVVRRFYYLIDFDPVFRLLADDVEVSLMKEEVWFELREKLYEEENQTFLSLAEMFSSDRTDDALTDLVFSLYNFSRAHPDPNEWLDNLAEMYQMTDSLTQSKLYQAMLKPQLDDILTTMIEYTKNAEALGEGEAGLEKSLTILKEDSGQLTELKQLLDSDDLDSFYGIASSYKFSIWKSPNKKKEPEQYEVAQEMKSFRDKLKDMYNKKLLDKYFAFSPKSQEEIMQSLHPLIEKLVEITKQFTVNFSAYKKERRLVDFNDLEHHTLAILRNKEEGDWLPSEASLYYREKFKEVMVDEYQDINKLQATILSWLAKSESEAGNQFMVGDVKQSIYSFRLADPTLFLEKYEDYKNGQSGERIVLAENFRSHKSIIQFTNFIFSQLMNKQLGQLDYDEAAQLVNGRKDFPASFDDRETELLIYESEQEEEEETELNSDEGLDVGIDFSIDSKAEGQIQMTAQKITELIEMGYAVYDKKLKQTRPIQYKDVVLLVPTKKHNITIQEIFTQHMLPVAVKDTQNYFQTTEITIILSLLKIIDNPRQDIPLAAVLRSPLVGLDENELAAIRIANKTSDYYEALLTFVKHPPTGLDGTISLNSLTKKATFFLTQLERWREKARRLKLVNLIWLLYNETGFIDYVSGLSSGKQRVANLHALYEKAENYEKTSFKGLFQFIRFIEKMQKKDKDLAEPSLLSEDDNAVRVMTIHGSKGLEFPVVFIMDMTKQFNTQDLNKPYVFDEEYGAGMTFVDSDQRIKIATLAEVAIKKEKEKKLIAEAMRVLYVALTRAEQKLFLVGSYKNKEEAENKWKVATAHYGSALPTEMRLHAKSYMDWIGMSVARHETHSLSSKSQTNPVIHHYPVRFSVQYYSEQLLSQSALKTEVYTGEQWFESFKSQSEPVNITQTSIDWMKEANKLLNAGYSYKEATRTTSYQSVSEIKRLFEEPEDGKMLKVDLSNLRSQHRYTEDELPQPRFVREQSVPTSAEVGQGTHLVLQSLNLDSKPTEEKIVNLIHELMKKQLITKEIGDRIDQQTLLDFFETDLAQTIIQYSSIVKREVPFSLLLGADELFGKSEEDGKDHILIHGIIDGYIEFEDSLILFDYKTDQVKRFKDKAKEHMLDKYKGQLNLYRMALESITGKKVSSTYLVLLDTTEIACL